MSGVDIFAVDAVVSVFLFLPVIIVGNVVVSILLDVIIVVVATML